MSCPGVTVDPSRNKFLARDFRALDPDLFHQRPPMVTIDTNGPKGHRQKLRYSSANRALLYRMAQALLGTRDLDVVATLAWLAKFKPVAIP
jgi:hypothetical protein